MKNLKAIIIFLLFWSIVIWCAKLMKRKDKQQYIEFRASLPEMETVTDAEEREYISRVLKMARMESRDSRELIGYFMFYYMDLLYLSFASI